MDAYDQTGASLMLAGPSRAAVLLLALGPSGAGRLLRHLSHDEIRTLRKGAASQPPISAQQLDQLVTDFQEAFEVGPGISALDLEMQRLLREALPEDDLAAVLGEPDTGAPAAEDLPALWPRFEERGVELLQVTLALEHPQVVAVVLTRLSAEIAAQIVAGFEAQLRHEVLTRMLVSRPLSERGELFFETAFREVHLVTDERKGRSDRHVGFADIVNRMDKQQAEDLLSSIGETQPDDLPAIRRLLFAFEDLPTLSKRALLVLFDEVSSEDVTIALTGADETMRETILSALAARARRMVEAELAQPRQIDPKDIQAARRSIASLALRLANEGRIALTVATEE